jgi:hypothetical protein
LSAIILPPQNRRMKMSSLRARLGVQAWEQATFALLQKGDIFTSLEAQGAVQDDGLG